MVSNDSKTEHVYIDCEIDRVLNNNKQQQQRKSIETQATTLTYDNTSELKYYTNNMVIMPYYASYDDAYSTLSTVSTKQYFDTCSSSISSAVTVSFTSDPLWQVDKSILEFQHAVESNSNNNKNDTISTISYSTTTTTNNYKTISYI